MGPKLTQPEEVEHVLMEMAGHDMEGSTTDCQIDVSRILTGDFFALFVRVDKSHAKPVGRIE